MTKIKSPLKHNEDGHMLLTKEAHIEAHNGDAIAAGYTEEESESVFDGVIEGIVKENNSQKYINLGHGSTWDDHYLSKNNPIAKTIVLTEDNFHLYESDNQGFYTKKTQPEWEIEKTKPPSWEERSYQVGNTLSREDAVKEEVDKIVKKETDIVMQPFIDSEEYSDDELNTIKRYQIRLIEDNPLSEELEVIKSTYGEFGKDNVMRISEEMNISPHFLDIFKSENSNIYRVEDKTEKISPKLIRIKDDGQIEFITSKELKTLDPDFYSKLNYDTKVEHYKPLDDIKENVINSFGDYDEDKAYEHLKKALEPYGITVSIPMVLGDYIKLSVNGKEETINLNARYIQDAPGPFSIDFRRNSGSKIFNQIENFVKKNGKQSKVYDHEENIIEKNIKAANEFSEEYDNSIALSSS